MSEEEKIDKPLPTSPERRSSEFKNQPYDLKSPLSSSLAPKRVIFPVFEGLEEPEKEPPHEITMKFNVIMMKDGLSKHQIFNVKGEDKFGSFEMFRNYNDFLLIRNILVQRWPGCYVPPLPKKKIVGGHEEQHQKEKIAFFEDFYKKISQLQFLYYSKEFQMFLRGFKNNADLEKSMKTLPAESYQEVLKKYCQKFPEINGTVVQTDLMGRIKKFTDTLKTLKNECEKMKKVSKKIAEIDKAYNQQLSVLTNELLPNFENTCVREYLKQDNLAEVDEKLIFGAKGNFEKLGDEKAFLKKNSETSNLHIIHDIARAEVKEIEAFQETLAVRDQWELQLNKLIQKNKDYQMSLSNLSKGSAMANLLALGNRYESMHILKENIAKSITDIEHLLLLIDSINVRLGEFEIRKFKKERSERYFMVLNQLSQNSFETSFKLTTFWRNLKVLLNPEQEQAQE